MTDLATRRAWRSINRDDVIRAATRAIANGDYEQMTIRSLAKDLGVAPMTLYRHVRNRDDLLEEVVEQLLVRRWRPRCDPSHGMEWIIEAADKLRGILIKFPAALHVYLRHPVLSPSALKRMEAMLAVLSEVADEDHAFALYGTIQTYTVGFAAVEAGRARWARESTRSHDVLSRRLTILTSPAQFRKGLVYILQGVFAQDLALKEASQA